MQQGKIDLPTYCQCEQCVSVRGGKTMQAHELTQANMRENRPGGLTAIAAAAKLIMEKERIRHNCLDGRHESDGNKVIFGDCNASVKGAQVCRHCRCLFVEAE